MKKLYMGIMLFIILLNPFSAWAAQLTATSYSMINGATGSFNYRDFTYSPDPGNVRDVTGSYLSGGTGKLTDGVSPATSWYQEGWNTQWVGWDTGQGGTNPTVTFNFGSIVNINSVTVWVDNTIGLGGVYLPSSVSVGGTNIAIAADNINPAPREYTFSGLNITGTSVDVQFFQSAYQWIMIGEVSFNGTPTSVPLPSALLLFAPGLAGLAAIRRRFAG